MFTFILYGLALVLLVLSFFKDKKKTKEVLCKAWKAFESLLPQLAVILLFVGMMLTILDTKTISSLLGKNSGVLGMMIALVIGSITLVPSFVVFTLAASLLHSGAAYAQTTLFITTCTMVGIITLPMESKYFGRKIAIKRNISALVFAICISLIMGRIFG
jgi:uncharacterized membrane protein YraQ (UPF0718 family)